MLDTALSDRSWFLRTTSTISTVAWLVRAARLRTSSATTANPRPCSPARAASIAALSASMLVCSAMLRMVCTMAPMMSDCLFTASMLWAAWFRSLEIASMICTVCCTTSEPLRAQASFCTEVAWAESAALRKVVTWSVMSLANFTTLYRRPLASKIGL